MLSKTDTGKMIVIEYKASDIGKTTGILLYATGKIAVIQVIDDFVPDGIEIAVLNKVKKIFKRRDEKVYHKVYRNSDFYQEPPAFIRTDNFQKIFKEIRDLGYWVIIESVIDDEDFFDIGPIKRVTKSSVSLRYFDSKGKWDEKNTVIPFNEIVSIQFADIYSTQWKKYLEMS
jgi:hypothetical protein